MTKKSPKQLQLYHYLKRYTFGVVMYEQYSKKKNYVFLTKFVCLKNTNFLYEIAAQIVVQFVIFAPTV